MYLDQTDEQKQLRRQLRDYFAGLMTPQLIAETRGNEGGDAYKQIIRQLGTDGWLTLGWPEEYGGQGLGPVLQMVFFEEAQLARVPIPFVTINTVAPALMAHGSDEHKAFFLPKIAAGDLHFCIGYSEPEAGTDLASLKTSARREGDNWIINGSKVYTSSAEAADYVWLAARSDPEASSKHKGISIFMVDTQQKGFSYDPIHTVGDLRTNISFYEDVLCPHNMICGGENRGWGLITSQLNHERVGLAALGVYGYSMYYRVFDWACEVNEMGRRPMDESPVQLALAEAFAKLEAMRLMNWRMVSSLQRGEPDVALSAAIKTYGTEVLIDVYRILMGVVGAASLVKADKPGALLGGELELEYRKCQINTFGGGVTEVMRDLIATFGLAMPMHSR